MGIVIGSIEYDFIEHQRLRDENIHNDYACTVAGFLEQWFDESKTVIIPTSGSTGTPKLKTFPKTALITSALQTATFFNYQEGQNALLSLPVVYVAGMLMVVRAIVSELKLYLRNPSSNPDLASLPQLHFAPLTVYQFQKIFDKNSSQLNQIDKILLGGGPISVKTREMIAKLDSTVYHGYGMTETLTHIALRNLSKDEKHFTALPGVNLSTGQQDNLIISAPYLSGSVTTNDCVVMHSETSFEWKGRLDNIINSSGVKINPESVERKLESFIKQRFFVAGKSDQDFGEKVILVVEGERIDTYLLSEFDSSLSRYERPREILYTRKFELTDTGKIKRKETLLKASINN